MKLSRIFQSHGIGIHIFLFSIFYFLFSVALAGNIDPTDRWAWNDMAGWFDFYNPPVGVTVSTTELTGYASSSLDILSMNCSDFGVCGTSNYKVSRAATTTVLYGATTSAILSGWAWNDSVGWVSFNCSDPGVCGTSDYKVVIDTNGYFRGWAWNDSVGWISVNCAQPGVCGTSNYKVRSLANFYFAYGELESATYDTGVSGGVSYNSLLWQGTLPLNTRARFQLATSNSSSGPWTYKGPDGTSSTWYEPAAPDQASAITGSNHFGDRYFRYKIRLDSNGDLTQTPTVNKVIVNYSP